MKKVYYKKNLVGIHLTEISKGSVPITDGKEPLQMVTLKHTKGTYLKAHAHAPRRRITNALQECLIVKKGAAKIDLYPPKSRKKFKTISLKTGEVFILMNGGYGIHITKNAELIEVKNGPFLEDKVLL